MYVIRVDKRAAAGKEREEALLTQGAGEQGERQSPVKVGMNCS